MKIEDFQEALLRFLACRFGSFSYLESLEDWIGLHSRRELQTLAYPIKTNASQLN